MTFLKKHWHTLLVVATVSDFLIPYVLGLFLPNFNQWTQLISELGAVTSPVRKINDWWSIINGLLFMLAAIGIYKSDAPAHPLGKKLLALSVFLFGLGDCLMNGRFSNAGPGMIVHIHNAGSAVGFGALTAAPLFMVPFVKKSRHWIYYTFFIVGLLATGIYALPKAVPSFDLPVRGLFQRINLICLYGPLLFFASKRQGALRNDH